MAKIIHFAQPGENADLHQLALLKIIEQADLGERAADSTRLIAMRLERRSPVLAAALSDLADTQATIHQTISENARSALQHGERFLSHRRDMADTVERLVERQA